MISRALTAVALILTPAAAMAQNELTFRIGAGPKLAPGYFGDADLDTMPAFAASIERIQFGPIVREPGKSLGLSFGGSLRYIGERSAEDYSELAGLETVDRSLELGARVKYRLPAFEAFASLRYGAIGHKSFVSEIGGDFIVRPTDKITLTAGPRVLWGDDSYADTYFGITAAESAANGTLGAFDASAGMISAGAEVEATYDINDDWQVIGRVSYDALQGDAADSPISEKDDQISTQIVFTRKITFNF